MDAKTEIAPREYAWLDLGFWVVQTDRGEWIDYELYRCARTLAGERGAVSFVGEGERCFQIKEEAGVCLRFRLDRTGRASVLVPDWQWLCNRADTIVAFDAFCRVQDLHDYTTASIQGGVK